ncbi:Acetyltransferase (GNAT) family protein [Marinomonas spartinae]|uniref:Acetyltransferase (GNAT) family protein n=2 Tax=Marinomonas spartinae TaxID=1792290 RepID=A0A1A8T6R3_9GAMM|nr:Acetyltransferase (GNAT) family protein [Marinomonas spartinae]SBS29787.1 Acetyltransferase (GNAT) family protein [Marinomonas spartinae]
MMGLTLRLASMKDADCLFEWRNDPETRKASHSTEWVEVADHMQWLKASLSNSNRRLYIAEKKHVSVGTIRADFDNGTWTLSWSVSPRYRNKGIASQMLALAVKKFNEPLAAEVKAQNIASIKVAQRAGFILQREQEGVLYFQR